VTAIEALAQERTEPIHKELVAHWRTRI